MRNKMGFFQCMKKSVLQRVRRIIGVVSIVRWHCVVYIEEMSALTLRPPVSHVTGSYAVRCHRPTRQLVLVYL